jgi:hypothetical protein
MSDVTDSPGDDDGGADDFDVSDATIVEDFTPEVAAQLGRGVAAVAQHLGRYGDSLGGIAIDLGRYGDPRKHSETLTTAHACGMNVARYLREALEHVGAANELIGKAARRARAQSLAAPR